MQQNDDEIPNFIKPECFIEQASSKKYRYDRGVHLQLKIEERIVHIDLIFYRFHLVNQAIKRAARRSDGQGVSVL